MTTTMWTKLIQKLFVKYLHAPWNVGKKEAQAIIVKGSSRLVPA
jgi:hypothetical protein